MSPIAGFVRLRQHNFGRQSALGTVVATKRAYGFRGVPTPNLNWTDPEVDTGALVPVVVPFRGAPDLTAALTDPRLAYNSLPILFSGIFGGGITPSGAGTAKTWAFDPSVVIPLDADDVYTYEFGDDVLTDWYQFGDGLLESVEIVAADGGGVLTSSMAWRFGSVRSTGSTDSPVVGVVPTVGIAADPAEVLVYLKDLGIYLSDSPYDLDANQVTDALHSFTLRITQARDEKRFANADQSFEIDAYGRGAMAIELEAQWAKTADTVGTGSESDAWLSDQAVNRYVQIAGESTVDAQVGTPYSWTLALPMRYYTRAETEIGGNTTITLTGHAFYDPDEFGGVFRTTVVNTLATGEL
jgi:hypothetical protein